MALHTESTPWGLWEVVAEGTGWKVKTLTVLAGKRTSLQRHQDRIEYWRVLTGRGLVTVGEYSWVLCEPEEARVERAQLHRIEGLAPSGCTLLEVQYGWKVEEADIERLHDDFGRATV